MDEIFTQINLLWSVLHSIYYKGLLKKPLNLVSVIHLLSLENAEKLFVKSRNMEDYVVPKDRPGRRQIVQTAV